METGDKVLISTSRKPSQKTRTFCKNLSHAFGFDYTNRGKSSLRDMLVKASQMNHDTLLLVYQIKGNPSKLTFYDLKAQEKLALLISANEMNERPMSHWSQTTLEFPMRIMMTRRILQ